MQCGVVWCGVVWCGVVWCGATLHIKTLDDKGTAYEARHNKEHMQSVFSLVFYMKCSLLCRVYVQSVAVRTALVLACGGAQLPLLFQHPAQLVVHRTHWSPPPRRTESVSTTRRVAEVIWYYDIQRGAEVEMVSG